VVRDGTDSWLTLTSNAPTRRDRLCESATIFRPASRVSRPYARDVGVSWDGFAARLPPAANRENARNEETAWLTGVASCISLIKPPAARVETGLKSPRRLKVGCSVRLRPTDFEPIHYSAGLSLRVMGGREHYSYRNRTRRICCFPSKNLSFFLTSNKLLNNCLKRLKRLEVLLSTFSESNGIEQWPHITCPPTCRGGSIRYAAKFPLYI
jgi:hypothetical protein